MAPVIPNKRRGLDPTAGGSASPNRLDLRGGAVSSPERGRLRTLWSVGTSRWRPSFGRWMFNNAPMVAFLLIYLFTCLLGALLMLANYRPFVRLFEYFSGTHIPFLTTTQGLVVLVLLCVAPLCLWLGFALTRRLSPRAMPRAVVNVGTSAGTALRSAPLEPPSWVPASVFGVSGAVAFISIANAGALAAIPSWLNYGHFIAARETIFSHVSFLEFVNIYMVLPLSAAWVLLTFRRAGILVLIARWLPLAFTVVIDLLLFQKKTAIISLLIVGFAWLFFQARRGVRRRSLVRGACITVVLGLITFFAAVVVPVYSRASSADVCLSGPDQCSKAGQVPALLAYSLLSPLTRTSAPVLYYPIVFPREHRYYGLDLFQDEIGLPSAFPDDNRVIWNVQNPHGPSGTSAAPFQFALYSGTGLIGTLLECFVIGGLMGLLWRLATSDLLSSIWSSLLASSECVFGVYLAIDSWRNDTTVSYGALWALFFLVVAALSVHLLSDRARQLRSWRGALSFALLAVFVVAVVSHDYGSNATYAPATQTLPLSTVAANSTSPPPRATGLGLPRNWSLAVSGVRIVPSATAISVTTTRTSYGYQIESPVFTLPSGRYVASLQAQVRRGGGIALGVLDVGAQRWLGNVSIRSRRPTRVSTPIVLAHRIAVRVILSNDSPRVSSSRWVVTQIGLSSLRTAGLTKLWRLGLG